MTWPELPPGLLFVETSDGALLVDRRSRRVFAVDPIGSSVLRERTRFGDVNTAARWHAAVRGARYSEVLKDLQGFGDVLRARAADLGPPARRRRSERPEAQIPDREFSSWIVDALGSAVQVTCRDTELVSVLDPLFPSEPAPGRPASTIDVWIENETVCLARDGKLLFAEADLGVAVARYVSTLTNLSISLNGARQIAHAGAVSCGGKGVLLLGASNQGKSSTVVELVTRGANYLTDEVSRIDVQQGTIAGLRRAIGLEGEARSLFPQLKPTWWPESSTYPRWSVAPSALGRSERVATLDAFVFLAFDLSTPAIIQDLPAPESLARFIPLLYHPENLDDVFLEGLVYRIEQLPTYLVRHSGARSAAECVAQVIQE